MYHNGILLMVCVLTVLSFRDMFGNSLYCWFDLDTIFLEPQVKSEDESKETTPVTEASKYDRLSFSNIDISAVLQNGKLLLGSAGKEYDLDLSDLDPAERLAIQRKNLAANLGIMTTQFIDGKDIRSVENGLSTRA